MPSIFEMKRSTGLSIFGWLHPAQPLPSLLLLLHLLGHTLGCDGQADLYPPSPFHHVEDGFPEIIALREDPVENDQPAYDDYWAARQEVFENSLDRTILAQAPEIERELFTAIGDSRYAVARKLADEILQNDPDSLIGLYAMAQVEAFAEGDMPYALNSIRQARRQAEALAKQNPRDPLSQEWYVYTLSTEWDILNEMDRLEEMLIVADRIEAVYAPVPWMKTFALIKLNRFDEARAEIAKYKGLGRFDVHADNCLILLEDKTQSRESILPVARKTAKRFPDQRVLQYNLGLAAINNASFGEAEQAFVAASKIANASINNSPFVPLAGLLVQQGRFLEALDAVKQAQVDRGLREPYTLQQDEASTNFIIATVLLAYNESDLAMRFARRATESPDRAAFTSNDERILRISDGLILWTTLKYKQQELQEQLSVGAVPTTSSLAQIASLETSMWTTKQKFISEMTGNYVVDLVTPYKPGAVGIESQVQSWHRFMLLDLLPLGVLEVAIAEADEIETQPWIPPYLHTLAAGIRLRKNDPEAALQLATEALDKLPPRAEKVYRGFVNAIAGEAAWQLSQPDVANKHWNSAIADFPQAFRLLDIQVPIRVTHQGAERESEVARLLASSSRFFESDHGYEIVVRPFDDQQLLIEMFLNDRSRHLELVVPVSQEDGFTETTVDQFHQKFFQPLVELTQTDLGSLDGSPVIARMRREVDQLFSDLVESEEPN